MTQATHLLPRHVAIIMDGNGRWAQARQLPRIAGHEQGVKAVENVIKAALEKKIPILTLFAFGIENWQRPSDEVNFLMDLFVQNLEAQLPKFIENNIQLRIVGDRSNIDSTLRQKIIDVEQKTAHHQQLILVIAFNYSGRWDILQATQTLCAQAAAQQLDPTTLSYTDLQKALAFADLPDPDLFIRTSGELRISNFMLWQLAYTELYFTDVLWPDFNEEHFQQALDAFASRQRRYGLTAEQVRGHLLPQGEKEL